MTGLCNFVLKSKFDRKKKQKKNKKKKNKGDFFVLTPMFIYCFPWRCIFDVDMVSLCEKIFHLTA